MAAAQANRSNCNSEAQPPIILDCDMHVNVCIGADNAGGRHPGSSISESRYTPPLLHAARGVLPNQARNPPVPEHSQTVERENKCPVVTH